MAEGMEDLAGLWKDALVMWDSVEQSELRGDSEEFKEMSLECQRKFQEIGEQVNKLALFSSNETIQDIQTSYIPYILLPYYLALLEQKRMDDRKRHLNNAKLFFGNFVSVCDAFELLSADERKQAEKDVEVKDRREDLIARSRKEREVAAYIEHLRAKKEKIIQTRGTEAYEGSDEEETERALHIANIKQAVLRTFKEVRMIEQELPMLEHMEALQRGEVKPSAPPEPKKNPQPPITLFRDHKGELKAQVFRPHWIQPTMTIEQQAEIEMQNMVTGGGPQSEKKDSDSEDSDPDDDEKYRKQREWDDWCDDNPKGSGNTLGNIS